MDLIRRALPLLALLGLTAAAPAPRVFSLDQCADQFVMALVSRPDIVGLSYRADDADSYLRAQARGLPLGRVGLEPILAKRAQLVVRYWGGDPTLTRALERRGVRVVRIEDAQTFDGVRANMRAVAAALGQTARGEALVRRMDGELAEARGAGRGRSALYLTSGGFTAGPDTLVGAMIAAAGFRNVAGRMSFQPIALERMTLSPPDALVLGFFDPEALATQRWAFGRHRIVRKLARERTLARLPSDILACPAWFAADGPARLAAAARAR
ncbi:MAG: transporter substrate-binding protein [Caulobacteraceae bacterium]|nr:transporter substrate-binding protein [Caulobacteraceae bacterium]